MDRGPPVVPGLCLLERGGEAEQLGLLAEAGDELQADGQAGAAAMERQRQGGMAGAVEEGGEGLDRGEVIEQVLDRGAGSVELVGAERERQAGVGRRQQDVVAGEELRDLRA